MQLILHLVSWHALVLSNVPIVDHHHLPMSRDVYLFFFQKTLRHNFFVVPSICLHHKIFSGIILRNPHSYVVDQSTMMKLFWTSLLVASLSGNAVDALSTGAPICPADIGAPGADGSQHVSALDSLEKTPIIDRYTLNHGGWHGPFCHSLTLTNRLLLL